MSLKKNIVIIGGGAGGFSVAKSLSDTLDASQFSIKLVNDRPFNIHYPAMIRVASTSEGSLETLTWTPYTKLFSPGKAGEVVIGSVERIEDGAAVLKDGRVLQYDWLVLATGTKWEGPLDLPYSESEALEWINSWRAKIAKSRHIVLGGGGSIGIEFAGEILHYFPDKEVTIVHMGDELLNNTYPLKFRRATKDAIERKGAKVILSDRLELPVGDYSSVMTVAGRKLDADLVIPSRAGRPNTRFLESFDSTILTSRGTVKVLPTLQVPLKNAKTNVYAIGDIIEWDEQKSLSKIPSHAAVLVANLLSDIRGQQVVKRYSGFMEAISIPFGPNGGITFIPLLWGLIFGNWITRLLKSKTLFLARNRKALNYA